jgi:hypothetical protein
MADKLGARKNSSWLAVGMAPDFCKTPVGSSTPPIPYMVVADLGQSEDCVLSVRFNGDPCKVLDRSVVPMCTGDEPGTAKGVKSGTVADKVEPTGASSTVRAEGKCVVREGDPCTLNSGNCHGIYVTQSAPGCAIGTNGRPAADTEPAVEPNEKEKSFLEKLGEWWRRKKEEMGAAVESPGQGTVGALKDTANTVPELAEMMARGSALNQAGEMEQAAALQRLFGLSGNADQLQASAEALRQGANEITLPKFELSNPAQAGGATIAQGLQLLAGLAGLAKGAAKTGARALAKGAGRAAAGEMDDPARIAAKASSAANEVKAADAAGDAVKAEKAMQKEAGQLSKAEEAAEIAATGDGVKIIKMRKGYRYELDELGRVKKVEGELKRNPAQGRNKTAQLEAGGEDRLPTDEGGHYVGRRFDGPTDDFNHFAQDQNFNRGAYKQLENEWDNYLKSDNSVAFEITPNYPTGSLRPDTLSVKYWVNGQKMPTKFFVNAPGG